MDSRTGRSPSGERTWILYCSCAVWTGPHYTDQWNPPHLPQPGRAKGVGTPERRCVQVCTGVRVWAVVHRGGLPGPIPPGSGKPKFATLLRLMHGLPVLHFFNKRNIVGRLQAACGISPLFPCPVPL